MTLMTARVFVLVTTVSLLAACASRPTVEAVSKFSVALDGAAASVQQGLGSLQRQETAANDAKEAENFIREKDPNIQFGRNANITDAVIAPRVAFFKALSKYAESLASAVSNEHIDQVRAQFAATGEAFGELGKAFGDATGMHFNDELAKQVSTAVGNIAAQLVEAKLNRDIPPIVTAVHGDLMTGVEAFKADLGDPKTGGFRALMNESIELLAGQKKKLLLLLKKEGKLNSAELYDAVLQAQTDVRRLRDSSRLLDAIPPMLDKLVKAHAALMTPSEPTSLATIQVFFASAKEVQVIVNSLAK